MDRYTDKFPTWQHNSTAKWLSETYATSTDFTYGKLPGLRSGNGDFGSQTTIPARGIPILYLQIGRNPLATSERSQVPFG
jgi:hypothetical protein